MLAGSAAGSILLLSGCAGVLEEDEDSGGGGDGGDGGADQPQTETLIDKSYEVSEDEWGGATGGLNADAEITVDFTVRDGPAIDFFVMTEEEYDYYRNGERFKVNSQASIEDETTARYTVEIPEGDYAFIVDNTERGEAKPPANLSDDVVTVELTVTATPL
jgi:hypothetical protein